MAETPTPTTAPSKDEIFYKTEIELFYEMAALLADYARQSRNVLTPTPRSLIARTRAVLDEAGVDWRA